jgi:pyruvate dehydrogenase E2 component (dihydrolipoamide acetyltransferase)
MAEIIRMPKLSDTMTEGVIAEWHKKEGDEIKSGDLLADIESDKATMEFESYEDGVLLHIGVATGDKAPVNAILAIVGEKGEDVSALLAAESTPSAEPESSPAEEAAPEVAAPAPSPQASTAPAPVAVPVAASASSTGGRIKASPLAKKMAQENSWIWRRRTHCSPRCRRLQCLFSPSFFRREPRRNGGELHRRKRFSNAWCNCPQIG